MSICKRVAFTLVALVAALCLAPAAANAMTIYADIEGESGDPLALEVESGDSIDNVKEKIREQTGLGLDRQNLYYGDTFLDPYWYLAYYNIQKGSTLTVKVVVPINETYFPDANFRSCVEAFDTDGDGVLDAEEVAAVTEIDCSRRGIANLEGIEYFTDLEVLYCVGNSLTTLDMSGNLALKTLYCANNKIASLDISQNSSLENLWCQKNELTSLDVSGCPSLGDFECQNNLLTEIDVSQNPELWLFACFDNQLTSLDVSNNPNLAYLFCHKNSLTSLDVSKNEELDSINCSNNRLTSLDLSHNPMIMQVVNEGCSALIGVDGARTFDLSTLPGFDVNRASEWTGGTVDGTILTVDEGVDAVTYTYDLGILNEHALRTLGSFTLEIGYAVSFDTAGGSAVEGQTVAKGGTVTKPAGPTKDKCAFAGWYADEACTQEFDFSAPITKATTIYAGWTPVEDEDDGEKGDGEQGKDEGDEGKRGDEKDKDDEGKRGDETDKRGDGNSIPQTGDSSACAAVLLAGVSALTVGVAAKTVRRNG